MNENKENINRIRDILLGNNIAEMENRFLKLDQQITFSLEEVENKWKQNLDSLSEEQQLSLEKNSQQLSTAINNLAEELKPELAGLKTQLSEIKQNQADLKASIQELQELQLKQKQSLKTQLETEISSLKKGIQEKFGDLQLNKIDRTSLAVLISDLAIRLSGDENTETETD
ncbi:MAG: hypothetical protein PF694_09425 [Bacteroidetes bacterium]|jgi:DNA repair exonuclease SbcCD ATPase subunit|nr:hypothetical protein [Bacteroidota bacterium]